MNPNTDPQPEPFDPDVHIRMALQAAGMSLITFLTMVRAEAPVTVAGDTYAELKDIAFDILAFAVKIADKLTIFDSPDGHDFDEEFLELLRRFGNE